MLPRKRIKVPKCFLGRLQRLCQRTIQRSENAVEQAVINQEADRLLAAFINGLIGTLGKRATADTWK